MNNRRPEGGNQAAKPNSNPAPAASGQGLLHIIGGPVLTGILPIMGLRPGRIVLARVGGEAADRANAQFRQALQVLSQEPSFKGWQPKIQEVVMQRAAPDISEARDCIASALVANQGMGVNFTGASQLVAIGAHHAAMALGRASFSTDLAQQRIQDGRTSRTDRWPDLRDAVKLLSVRLLMAFDGKNLDDWRSEKPSDAMRAFGLKAFELRTQHWGALESFNKALESSYFLAGGKLPQTPDELKTLLTKPLPPACTSSDAGRQLVAAAVSAGLVKAEGPGHKLVAQPSVPAVERALHTLMRCWIELAVYDCLLRNPRYQDAHGFLSSSRGLCGDSPGEADLLCVDLQTASLRQICCKMMTARHADDHHAAMVERSHRLGATARTMVVFKPTGNQESSLRACGKKLDTEVLLEADEIVKGFAPAVK